MEFSFWQFFYDPVLRAPTLGSMLMGFASALMGVVVFVRRRSLLGEALAHAAYPGLIISILLISVLDGGRAAGLLIGAFITAFLGLFVIEKLERNFKINPDAALCLVLALFLGVGVLVASRLQFTHPILYQQAQVFLYGQAATMNDQHIFFYGGFSLLVLSFLVLKFRHLELVIFDQSFAKSIKVGTRSIDITIFILLILALIIGIRSVGVVLMSGMLIAPAAAARQWTHRFSILFALAGFFGLISGFLGNYLSVYIPLWVGGDKPFSLPTGPMILLFSSSLCLFSLLFAPQRGAAARLMRIMRFRFRCISENVLKVLWKEGIENGVQKSDILKWNHMSGLTLALVLGSLKRGGWITEKQQSYLLTRDGVRRAARLIRLHRLWELYLASCMKMGEEKVHRSAEEMEHILTPELEQKLTELLQNPQKDPHDKPIPKAEDSLCTQ